MLWNFTASLLIKIVSVHLVGHINLGTKMFPGLDLQLSNFLFSNAKCYYFNRPSPRKLLPVCSNITFLARVYTCDARKFKYDMSCEWREIFLLPTNPLRSIVGGYLFSFTSLDHRGKHQLQTQFTQNINGIHLRQKFIIFFLLSILFCASNIATYGTVNAQCFTEGFVFHLHNFCRWAEQTKALVAVLVKITLYLCFQYILKLHNITKQ